MQGWEIPPSQCGGNQSPVAIVGRLDEVRGGARKVRSASVQVGEGEIEIRHLAVARSLRVDSGDHEVVWSVATSPVVLSA